MPSLGLAPIAQEAQPLSHIAALYTAPVELVCARMSDSLMVVLLLAYTLQMILYTSFRRSHNASNARFRRFRETTMAKQDQSSSYTRIACAVTSTLTASRS